MQSIHKLSIAFLLGSIVPASMIYLTGGSNRTNLVIGLILGAMAVIMPILIRPRWTARLIVRLADGVAAFQSAFHQDTPQTTTQASVGQGDTTNSNEDPVPFKDDATSALTNLGLPSKRAGKLIHQLIETGKTYARVEDLIQDAVKASKPSRVA